MIPAGTMQWKKTNSHNKNKKEIYTEGAKDWTKKEISMGYRWVKGTDVEWILSDWKVIKV